VTARRTAAVRAAVAAAERLGLRGCRGTVIADSNNTIVGLEPSAVVAKVGTSPFRRDLGRELEVAAHLVGAGAPVVTPSDVVPPGPHREGGLELTFWRRYRNRGRIVDGRVAGDALRALHESFAGFATELPPFETHLADAGRLLARDRALPTLAALDRAFLRTLHAELTDALAPRAFDRRPLHGEPHLGNLLDTDEGPFWLDLESACSGPLEWDLASLPDESASAFEQVDDELLALLRRAKSLCVAVWCWRQPDRAPEVGEAAHVHLRLLRAGY
jgi:Phosphotransferase enzyme family